MKIFYMLLIVFIFQNAYGRPLTDDERISIENSVKENLKDPDSAKFYHGDFPYPDTAMLYCGYVNAKNSYGGYTGKQLFSNFVAINNKGRLVTPVMDYSHSTGEFYGQDIIAVSCASAGYDLPVKAKFFKQVNEKRKEHGIPPLGRQYIQ